MQDLFLAALIALKLWRQFVSCAGIVMEESHLQHSITKWWRQDIDKKLHSLFKAVPLTIMWTLRKRRNSRRHGNNMSFDSLLYQCQQLLCYLDRSYFPWIQAQQTWPELLLTLEGFRPKIYYLNVRWSFPNINQINGNTDGASRAIVGRMPMLST